jgi:hypothetical protein
MILVVGMSDDQVLLAWKSFDAVIGFRPNRLEVVEKLGNKTASSSRQSKLNSSDFALGV